MPQTTIEEQSQEAQQFTAVADVKSAPTKKQLKIQQKAKKKERKNEKKRLKAERKLKKKEARAAKKAEKNKVGPYKKRRWRWGDRRDGRLLRSLTPFARLSPYIMKIRSDAQNHFEEEIDITDIEAYMRDLRKQGYKNIGLLHLFIAAYVRTIAHRPGINRFISGNKVYARNNIEVVMTVKKQLSTTSPDTTMKCVFEPTDTLIDVYEKWNAVLENTVGENANTDFDNTAKILNYIPGLLLKFVIWLLRALDYFGLLPRVLTRVSPFHGSMVITSMGSLGIGPIYHHLYDFGNLPVFLSYGKMYSKIVVDEQGTPSKRHFICLRAVTDERICDGYYYASAFKSVLYAFKHPETLETPPAEVVEDID